MFHRKKDPEGEGGRKGGVGWGRVLEGEGRVRQEAKPWGGINEWIEKNRSQESLAIGRVHSGGIIGYYAPARRVTAQNAQRNMHLTNQPTPPLSNIQAKQTNNQFYNTDWS